MITSGVGCTEAKIVLCRTAWRKFKELLCLLTTESISLIKKLWKSLLNLKIHLLEIMEKFFKLMLEALFFMLVSGGLFGKMMC